MDLLDKENRTLLKYVTNNFNAERTAAPELGADGTGVKLPQQQNSR
jgi:hypothetical protein